MVGEARPGYELWRPNRAKASSQLARFTVILLLLVSAALMLVIVLGGWSLLTGGGTWAVISLIIVALYVLMAVMTGRWSRGALTLTIAFSILMLIFGAIGFESWFARDKAGFSEAGLPSALLGTLLLLLVPLQIALATAATIAFRQEWHVEEERPIGSGDGGAVPPPDSPRSEPASPSPA
jgi:hypothetical protein